MRAFAIGSSFFLVVAIISAILIGVDVTMLPMHALIWLCGSSIVLFVVAMICEYRRSK